MRWSDDARPAGIATKFGNHSFRATGITAYLDGAGLRDDPKGPLFRTIGRGTGKLIGTVLKLRRVR